MPTILLTNANIVCLENAASWGNIPNGTVAVNDDVIEWVGKSNELPFDIQHRAIESFNCDGQLLTPGLIDCHTHLVYAGNRAAEFEQRLCGISYSEIAKAGGGIMNTVRATREASVIDLMQASRHRLQAMMAEGITTIEIKSGYGLETEAEVRMLEAAKSLGEECGVKTKLTFLAAHALPAEYNNRSDQYIDLVCNEMLPAAGEAGLVDAVDAFCETIGFSLAQVERVFDAAEKLGFPIKCHAEQLSNTGAAAMCARRGALSADHLEFLTPEDVAVMRNSKTVAVLLPGAFFTLREQQHPPLQLLRDAGIPIALATDANPGSSPIFSPLTTMNMGCTLFSMTPLEAVAGFTVQAAQALGIADQTGSITAGKQADLALWRCEHPAELSYQIGLNPCVRVMQDGVWRDARKDTRVPAI